MKRLTIWQNDQAPTAKEIVVPYPNECEHQGDIFQNFQLFSLIINNRRPLQELHQSFKTHIKTEHCRPDHRSRAIPSPDIVKHIKGAQIFVRIIHRAVLTGNGNTLFRRVQSSFFHDGTNQKLIGKGFKSRSTLGHDIYQAGFQVYFGQNPSCIIRVYIGYKKNFSTLYAVVFQCFINRSGTKVRSANSYLNHGIKGFPLMIEQLATLQFSEKCFQFIKLHSGLTRCNRFNSG